MPQRSWSRYRAFGLRLQSALPLPELRADADADARGTAPADVVVTRGEAPCPTALPEIAPGVRAGPDAFWMAVPGTARLLVRGGAEMVVDADPDAAAGDVRAYLLGSAMGALLHQRGLLPLHASAVAIGGRAVAFVAPSGGGKSTLAMHLQERGHPVIADDIAAIEVAGGAARLWPGLANLKLWRASLAAIDRSPDGLEPVVAAIDKYRVPLHAPAAERSWPLAAIVSLAWGETPALTPLAGAAAVGTLVANTFRGQLVAAMGREAAHWRQCLDVFGAAEVRTLARPRALGRLDEASALIVSAFSEPSGILSDLPVDTSGTRGNGR